MKGVMEFVLSWTCTLLGHPGACWLLNSRLGQWALS